MLIWFQCCTGLCSSSTSTAEPCSNWRPAMMWWENLSSLFLSQALFWPSPFFFFSLSLAPFPHFLFRSHDWATLEQVVVNVTIDFKSFICSGVQNSLSCCLSFSPQLTVEYKSLDQGHKDCESLSSSLLRRKKEAETTFLFWKTHSGKTTVSTTLFYVPASCNFFLVYTH